MSPCWQSCIVSQALNASWKVRWKACGCCSSVPYVSSLHSLLSICLSERRDELMWFLIIEAVLMPPSWHGIVCLSCCSLPTTMHCPWPIHSINLCFVFFTNRMIWHGPGPVLPPLTLHVFAVQFGFSALLCSSALLTLWSICPVSILSQGWPQHVTQSHVVMFWFVLDYVCFFCFASQE